MDNIYLKREELNDWIKRNLPNKDLISINDLLDAIEEMDSNIQYLEQKLEDAELEFDEKLKDFYKPKTPYEIYGVSENDFH